MLPATCSAEGCRLALARPLGASRAITQHRQLYRASSETHGLGAARRPDIDSAATDQSARVSYQVFPAISGVFESYTRTQR